MSAEISLGYNPFEAKTTFEYKGKPETLKCFGNGDSRLQDWLYEFFPDVVDQYNLGPGDECHVSFWGTPGDFEDLEQAREVFLQDNPQISIVLEHTNKESKRLENRLSDLRVLFARMQEESPYDELRDPILKGLFERAVSTEFEISVIATVSSGKSTLINSLLGQEILPARNEATTAKIARIRDVDGMLGFKAKGLKRNTDDILQDATEEKEATLEFLESLNGDDNIDIIEIVGDVPGVHSREMKLLLSDTPGPNNSRTVDHARHIDDLIKADYKPMIMYILNATQLEINDDHRLLHQIAQAMSESGKQSKDRFLFVLNKADALDPQKNEWAEKKVEDCKTYLSGKFGIEGSRLFPVSSQLAKVIRMSQSGKGLTEDEEDFLSAKRKRAIQNQYRHFSDFVSLSPSCKRQQEQMLQEAIAKGDENTQALIYSGVPAIELAVDEYLEKYAFTAKISQAVGVFNEKIKKLDLKNKTQTALAQDSEKREAVVKELASVKALIKNGKKAQGLVDKFDGDIKEIEARLKAALEQYEDRVNKFFGDAAKKFKRDKADRHEAEALVKETEKAMELEYETIGSDLGRLFQTELKQQAEKYLAEYQDYIAGLMSSDGYAVDATMNLIQLAIPGNTGELVARYTKETQTSHMVEIDNGKRWYKIWTWFRSKQYEERIETHTHVDMSEIWTEIQKQAEKFFSVINEAEKVAKTNATGLKDFFKKEIGRLDSALQEAISQQETALASQETLERQIEENKAKAAWLDQFIIELNSILSI